MNLFRTTALTAAALALIGCDSNDGPEAAPPAANVIFDGSEVLSGSDY